MVAAQRALGPGDRAFVERRSPRRAARPPGRRRPGAAGSRRCRCGRRRAAARGRPASAPAWPPPRPAGRPRRRRRRARAGRPGCRGGARRTPRARSATIRSYSGSASAGLARASASRATLVPSTRTARSRSGPRPALERRVSSLRPGSGSSSWYGDGPNRPTAPGGSRGPSATDRGPWRPGRHRGAAGLARRGHRGRRRGRGLRTIGVWRRAAGSAPGSGPGGGSAVGPRGRRDRGGGRVAWSARSVGAPSPRRGGAVTCPSCPARGRLPPTGSGSGHRRGTATRAGCSTCGGAAVPGCSAHQTIGPSVSTAASRPTAWAVPRSRRSDRLQHHPHAEEDHGRRDYRHGDPDGAIHPRPPRVALRVSTSACPLRTGASADRSTLFGPVRPYLRAGRVRVGDATADNRTPSHCPRWRRGQRITGGAGDTSVMPYPVVAEALLPVVEGVWYRRRRREPTEIPLARPGSVYVFRANGAFAIWDGQHVDYSDEVVVNARTVSMVDVRPRQLPIDIVIPSALPEEDFTVRSTFRCRVTEPAAVAEAGLTDLDVVLASHLASDDELGSVGRSYGVEPGPPGAAVGRRPGTGALRGRPARRTRDGPRPWCRSRCSWPPTGRTERRRRGRRGAAPTVRETALTTEPSPTAVRARAHGPARGARRRPDPSHPPIVRTCTRPPAATGHRPATPSPTSTPTPTPTSTWRLRPGRRPRRRR